MTNIYCIGIDLAKNIFHLHAVNYQGQQICKQKLSRNKLIEFIAQTPPCIVAMEACSGANYFAKKFREFGHQPKIIAAQFVKPYIKSNKNDMIDASAICTAALAPDMRFANIKEDWQQDIANIHRSRSLAIRQRTALANSIRGMLAEYGIICAKSINKLEGCLREILSNDTDRRLSVLAKNHFMLLFEQLVSLSDLVNSCDKSLNEIFTNNEHCQRLAKIPGIGIITSTALVSEIGDGSQFKTGRELSSYLGLVPRQYSTGGKQRLLGISKRGNSYLRYLLIHGARSVLSSVKMKESSKKERTCNFENNQRLSAWFKELRIRKDDNVSVVALANKLSRISWAVLSRGTDYRY